MNRELEPEPDYIGDPTENAHQLAAERARRQSKWWYRFFTAGRRKRRS